MIDKKIQPDYSIKEEKLRLHAALPLLAPAVAKAIGAALGLTGTGLVLQKQIQNYFANNPGALDSIVSTFGTKPGDQPEVEEELKELTKPTPIETWEGSYPDTETGIALALSKKDKDKPVTTETEEPKPPEQKPPEDKGPDIASEIATELTLEKIRSDVKFKQSKYANTTDVYYKGKKYAEIEKRTDVGKEGGLSDYYLKYPSGTFLENGEEIFTTEDAELGFNNSKDVMVRGIYNTLKAEKNKKESLFSKTLKEIDIKKPDEEEAGQLLEVPEDYKGPTISTLEDGYDSFPFSKEDFKEGALDNDIIKKTFLKVSGDDYGQPFDTDKFVLTPPRGQQEIALRFIKQKLIEDEADKKIIDHITKLQNDLAKKIKKTGYFNTMDPEVEKENIERITNFPGHTKDLLKKRKLNARGGLIDKPLTGGSKYI